MTDNSDIIWLSAGELRHAYLKGELSPVEVVDAVLARLDEVEPRLNAFVTVTADEARRQAREAATAIKRGETDGPLVGIPVTVKDLTSTAGVRTTFGSTLYAENIPTEDDVDWARLKAAGAILIGKTTTPEFGLLGVTESRLTGITSNPWGEGRTAGGSSGGAAASVAAGVAPIAWGSDGGGSIRVPAAFCGAVGLKPSEGRIPSLSQSYQGVLSSGPLTRTVRDAALALSITAGPDERDARSLPAARGSDYLEAVQAPSVAGLRIAVLEHFGLGPVSGTVGAVMREAAEVLSALGGRPEPMALNLPDPIDYFLTFWAPSFTQALAEMRALEGWADDRVHPTMLDVAERGTQMSAMEYWETAVVVRQQLYDGFQSVFERTDFIVVPTVPLTAFPHPGPAAGNTHIDGMEIAHPTFDFHRLTEPPSHAGLPAITVPCGFDQDGMPVGLQVIGRRFDDAGVLRVAAAFEEATAWHLRHPA